MEDQQFRQLLDRFGFSWAGFCKVRNGVKKRLVRHTHETIPHGAHFGAKTCDMGPAPIFGMLFHSNQ
jgi:hypothetical protein